MKSYLYEDLTKRIIRCFYNVYDTLGYGFLESVYENALMVELENNNIKAEAQKEIKVIYKGIVVGDFRADILVEDKVRIELKAVSKLMPIHETQVVNYLKSTGIKIGLLVNFGEKLEFKRKIY